MKKALLVLSLIGSQVIFAQRFITREAVIQFSGKTDLENIDAISNQTSSVVDAKTGELVFQTLVNSFRFEKALMQDHFNENYAESETYPKTYFKGKMDNWKDLPVEADRSENYKAKGVLNFHGVEKEVIVDVVLTVKDQKVKLESTFEMIPEDFDIDIPSAVRGKIAKSFTVTVQAKYTEMK